MQRFSVKRLLGGFALLGLLGAAFVFLGIGDRVGLPAGVDPAVVLRDLDGRRVALDLAPDVVGAEVADTGGRFVVPSADVDVPLLKMTVTRGVLNPPTLTDAFLVRDTDGPDDVRPTIVALHSVQGGRAAGNALAETVNGQAVARIGPGDALWADGVEYRVTSIDERRKEDAAVDPTIWAAVEDGADRLVVITCLQQPGGPLRAPDNLIIHAVRV